MQALRSVVFPFILSVTSLALVCGCGGGSGGASSPTPKPTPTPIPTAATRVFVANQTLPHTAVDEFAVGAGAGATPLNIISPALAGSRIDGLATDSSGNLYVADGGSIYEYAVGSSGAPTQTATIGAPATLGGTQAIAVDSTGQIYAASGSSIFVYPAGANASTSPVRTITGAATGLFQPFAVALDSSQNIYVSDCAGGGGCFISEFSAAANGNVAPIGSITGIVQSGQSLLFGSPAIVAVDRSDNIYFSLDLGGFGYVFEVPPGTSGFVASPTRILGGTNAAAASIRSITLDAVGNLYANVVIQSANDTLQLGIMTFPPTATSDSPPSSTITSSYLGNTFGYLAVQ